MLHPASDLQRKYILQNICTSPNRRIRTHCILTLIAIPQHSACVLAERPTQFLPRSRRVYLYIRRGGARNVHERVLWRTSLSLSLSPLSSSNDSGNSIPRVAVCASSLSTYALCSFALSALFSTTRLYFFVGVCARTGEFRTYILGGIFRGADVRERIFLRFREGI